MWVRPQRAAVAAGVCSLILAGCSSGPSNPGGNPLGVAPVQPVCAINWVNLFDNRRSNPTQDTQVNSPASTWRTDPATASNFGNFTPGRTVGNVENGGVPAVVAFDEAWYRDLQRPLIVQARVHHARVAAAVVPTEFEWSIRTIDGTGTASRILGRGRPTAVGVQESRDASAAMLPRLLPVGTFSPQMFACVNTLTDNGAVRTTKLMEVVPDTRAGNGVTSGVFEVQDLLYGDTSFVPLLNTGGPLRGPARPPSPLMPAIGVVTPNGMVDCAMTQRGDELPTRELHLLAVRNGELLHSVASNFGNATDGNGTPLPRFGSQSAWRDLRTVFPTNVGRVTHATVVATSPRGATFYFVAELNGRYRLWETMRSADTGNFSALRDVLALNGDAPGGHPEDFTVSAGNCPAPLATTWTDANTERLIVLRFASTPTQLLLIRHVSQSQNWLPGVQGVFSNWASRFTISATDAEVLDRNIRPVAIRVSGRPFGGPTGP